MVWYREFWFSELCPLEPNHSLNLTLWYVIVQTSNKNLNLYKECVAKDRNLLHLFTKLATFNCHLRDLNKFIEHLLSMGISQIIFTTFQVFKWNKIDEFQQQKVSKTIQKLILIASVDVNLFKSFCFCVKIDW